MVFMSLTKSYNNLKEKLGFKTLFITLSYVKEEIKKDILILSIDDENTTYAFLSQGRSCSVFELISSIKLGNSNI
jgi:hypothetical protein